MRTTDPTLDPSAESAPETDAVRPWRAVGIAAALSLTTLAIGCSDDAATDTVADTLDEATDEIGETADETAETGESGSSDDTTTETTDESTDESTEESTEEDTTTDESTEEDTTTDESTEEDTTTDETDTGGEELPIEVVITADNAYGFGYGTDDEMANYFGGIENQTAGQIFNCNGGPELYEIEAEAAANATQLYIIAWADSAVTQGVIAQFRRDGGVMGFGEAVLTGHDGWSVCATGENYSPGSGGPTLDTINDYIQQCNDGALDPSTTSGGWVDDVGTDIGAVAFGEENTTPYNGGPQVGNEFPLVCQNVMPEEAKWMWFNWDPDNIVWPQQTPFMWPGGGGNPDHQFLIFRFPAEEILIPQ